ncbi:SCO2524 family protein [Streptomyces chiangmaiensis]|uniref:SCO2524 family protein n=1 Tax=Streptomyces chiangmaiensis TaxID=766497 RepID=A0ABU7FL59_9ACTN|nr:SCO2524 family protein [Streptomyces chiangmaiensis]MED7824422.1 SCO2524 family protein [Streptomyces chiangmaiensis]
MQIKPRQHLLDIWQAVARHSFDGGEWAWGKWGGESSVSDAERLLCLLYPATEIAAFRLDDPDTTQDDVQKVLRKAGGRLEIPAKLVTAATQFMRTHTGEDKRPAFAGGYYFLSTDKDQDLTKEQRELGVVDSYSMSITLCLATLGFLKVYESKTRRSDVQETIQELRAATSNRLTAAMVSLLRSFTVNAFDTDSSQGRMLCELLGQGRLSQRHVLQKFQRRFRALRAAIVESFVLGVDVQEGLKDESQLFECGWGWSIVKDAPEVETDEEIGPQPVGVADPVPSLYFTVVALDGIQDLFSDRTLTLGLLNSEQQKLAEALRLRWEITQQFWSGIARFDSDRWPLEDIPWRTTGQKLESEYFSLSVAAILVHDLMRRRATDDDLTRTVSVMERLAERGRITSRMTRDDPMVQLHNPGVTLPLQGSERIGPPMQWTMTDFSAQLLKRTIQLCTLSRNLGSHDRLLRLAEDIFGHVWRRRIRDGEGAGLWDNVHAAYPESPVSEGPVSWSVTERVTEVMVQVHQMYHQPPIRSLELTQLARALLSESAHLLGNEQMEPAPASEGNRGMELRSIEVKLRRARKLVDDQPGTACALTLDVLGQLDALARAREAAAQGV